MKKIFGILVIEQCPGMDDAPLKNSATYLDCMQAGRWPRALRSGSFRRRFWLRIAKGCDGGGQLDVMSASEIRT
jgi:hypothetical protein